MKKLLNFIKQRWFISLLGVLALGLFIWFLGPFFAFADYQPLAPELSRFILIGLIVIFWLVVQIWSFVKTMRQNSKVLSAMVEQSGPETSPVEQASQEELQALNERMQDALGVLKKTRLGGRSGKQFLYQLPWYIIIGPPGSGKTTLLKNSNLKFPLSEKYGKDAIRGVSGTRNCDWWFTEEAVLLDTAGRYTTQDSDQQIDQSAWLGFLDLLKKYRRRRPISGAIIAVSITDLLEKSKQEQRAHANAIRQRVQELHERFGMRFPVYFLFTKCDLLAGFMQYFDDMSRDLRDQVWGITFQQDDDLKFNTLDQFETEFSALEQRLHNQVLDKLERERGGDRRNLIYTFPQQFSSLKNLIHSFLQETFETTNYELSVMFRGVYFTSATQEGSPIDRIMGSLAQNFGLDRQSVAITPSQGKSFFINRLLSDVIFSESGLAGTNLKFEHRRAWLQRLAFAGVLGVTLLMALIWLGSYFQNLAYIDEVSAQTDTLQTTVDELDPTLANPLIVLNMLNKVRNMPGGYADRDKDTPWSLNFGLYQGDKLGKASISLYQKLLKKVFLPRLMARLEQQLQENSSNPDYLYEALKVYLMLDDDKHYDHDAIHNWITLDWKHNLPQSISNEQRQSLTHHLDALEQFRPLHLPRPLNIELIAQARTILAQRSLSERIYTLLKLEMSDSGIPDFRINEKAGRDSLLVLSSKSGKLLTKSVPGLFTCDGYSKVFILNNERLTRQLLGESWVLGTTAPTVLSSAELNTLRQEVLQLYLKDYVKHWDSFLNDIRIKPFTNQTQMVEVLNIVSGQRSPVRQLLIAVDKETSMSCLNSINKSILDKAGDKLSTARSTLEKIMGQSPDTAPISAPQVTTNLVTNHFQELHQLVESIEGAPPALDQPLSLLNELYVYLNSLLHASGDELVLDQRKQVIQILDKVKVEGKRTPFPLNNIMSNIANDSHALVSGGVRKYLNSMWKSSVLPFCKKAIQGLYPINSRGTRDITYEDFTYFFAPGGLMDGFFNKYLAASVDRGGQNWRWNKVGDEPAGVSYAALKQFQRADKIKNIFFRMGRQTPSVSFKLKPTSMSSEITQLMLDVDGQVLNYAHGPVRPVTMSWPGPSNSNQVRLQFLPPKEGFSGFTKEGPWAFFHVLDLAGITPTSNPTIFDIIIKIHGRYVQFKLQASSAINPFQLTDLHSFQCPQHL